MDVSHKTIMVLLHVNCRHLSQFHRSLRPFECLAKPGTSESMVQTKIKIQPDRKPITIILFQPLGKPVKAPVKARMNKIMEDMPTAKHMTSEINGHL
jgi:hypothetical protein